MGRKDFLCAIQQNTKEWVHRAQQATVKDMISEIERKNISKDIEDSLVLSGDAWREIKAIFAKL